MDRFEEILLNTNSVHYSILLRAGKQGQRKGRFIEYQELCQAL